MTKKITIDTPALFGDHHVIEVRRILGEIPGVVDVYASSAFRAVEVTFDPDKVEAESINKKLADTGYLDELPVPMEADASTYLEADRSQSFFRHTQVFENSREVVSFSQNVAYSGRPLWYCPGIGVVTDMEE